MIHTTCPVCRAKLHAQDEWVGRSAKCPKCESRLRIPPADGEAELIAPAGSAAPPAIRNVPEEALPGIELPQRLSPHSRYLVLSRDKLLAAWEGDGQGWKLRTNTGYVLAARNAQLLPSQGDFRFVELQFERREEGLRLVDIEVYQLASRWALHVLARGEPEILEKITGYGGLARDQKLAVRQYLRERFMMEVWHQSHRVLEYLSSTDYHTHSVKDQP